MSAVAASIHPKPVLLPLPEGVQKILAELLDKPVTVKKITPMVIGPTTVACVASYVTDSGALAAVIVSDLALASHAGSALMLMPAGASLSTIKAGKLTETVLENVYEVLNICASLYIRPDHPHVRLTTVTPLPGKPPADVTAALAKPQKRLDLEVNIQGYGPGKMTFILV